MKIHQLITALDYGDAVSNDCIRLAEMLRELGYESKIFYKYVHPTVSHLGQPMAELKGSRNDVLILQFCGASEVLETYLTFPGQKVIKYHGITPPKFFSEIPGLEQYAKYCSDGLRHLKVLAGKADIAVGDSEYDRAELEAFGHPNTAVLPLALNLDELLHRAYSQEVVRKYRTNDAVNLLFVGRLAPNKRADDLIRLLHKLKTGFEPKARLIVVGNTENYEPFVEHVRALADQLGMREGQDFLLTGKVSDEEVLGYYRVADAFVCMSEHEGFCASVLESMAFGIPTFAYATTALPWTMQGGGVLFEKKDFDAMAARIHSVLTNPGEKQRLVQQQYKWIREFRPERTKAKLGKIIEGLWTRQEARMHRHGLGYREPSFSVVINTFNRASYLERCLAALKELEYDNFEVIVVNGPSTDNTEDVLAKFPGVRVCCTNQANLSISRNIGIHDAAGELVAFIDDDAFPEPYWLCALAECFSDSSVGGVGGLVFGPGGDHYQFSNGIVDLFGFATPICDEPGTFNDPHGSVFNTTMGTNSAFRRSSLFEIGLFDEEFDYYHDEADISVRLIKAGWKIAHTSRAMVFHAFARGKNRASNYDLNWFSILKNTIYYALKNGPSGWTKLRHAVRTYQEIRRRRFREFTEWSACGLIDKALYRKIRTGAFHGTLVGLWRGFWHPGKTPPEPMPNVLAIRPYRRHDGRPLHICLLTQDLPWQHPGGIADYTWRLARGLAAKGHTVHLITKMSEPYEEEREGVNIHGVAEAGIEETFGLPKEYAITHKNLRYSLAIAYKIQDLQESEGLDLVESPNWDFEGLAYALDKSAPLIVRLQTPLFKAIETNAWESNSDLEFCIELEKAFLRTADGIIGISNNVLQLIRTHYKNLNGIPHEVVPIGIASPPLAEHANNKNRARGGRLRVLFVGRLERRKGIHTLLEAIPSVLKEHPNLRFDIVGRDCHPFGPEETASYFARQVSPVVGGRVMFHGEVNGERLEALYQACDIFVAPSLYESFGIIYLEAMRHGKAVVGTKVGAIPEVVTDNVSGLLVPPDDPSALATAIAHLVQNSELRERLGKGACEAVAHRFTEARMCEQTLDFYRQVLSQQKTG